MIFSSVLTFVQDLFCSDCLHTTRCCWYYHWEYQYITTLYRITYNIRRIHIFFVENEWQKYFINKSYIVKRKKMSKIKLYDFPDFLLGWPKNFMKSIFCWNIFPIHIFDMFKLSTLLSILCMTNARNSNCLFPVGRDLQLIFIDKTNNEKFNLYLLSNCLPPYNVICHKRNNRMVGFDILLCHRFTYQNRLHKHVFVLFVI